MWDPGWERLYISAFSLRGREGSRWVVGASEEELCTSMMCTLHSEITNCIPWNQGFWGLRPNVDGKARECWLWWRRGGGGAWLPSKEWCRGQKGSRAPWLFSASSWFRIPHLSWQKAHRCRSQQATQDHQTLPSSPLIWRQKPQDILSPCPASQVLNFFLTVSLSSFFGYLYNWGLTI